MIHQNYLPITLTCILIFIIIVILLFLHLLQLHCPNGLSPIGYLGCLPWGKPAVTESRYPTYGACWVF